MVSASGLTRNYIYKYYTKKLQEAEKSDNITSKQYYDNVILGRLTFYKHLEKDEPPT